MPTLEVIEEPEFGELEGYRTIWVLATLNKAGNRLKGTHYAVCLRLGRPPTWIVTTINGRFIRFAASRQQIEADYPDHVWRPKAARWRFSALASEDEQTSEGRDHYLLQHFGR